MTDAKTIICQRLAKEHETLSALFVKYNTPGSGAPGFSEHVHRRLTAIERAMAELDASTSKEGAP